MNPYRSPAQVENEINRFRGFWSVIGMMLSGVCLAERLYWTLGQWHLYAQWYRNQCVMVICMLAVVTVVSAGVGLSASWKIRDEAES